jgi:hypothetical protein
MILPDSPEFCIDKARVFQKTLLNLFKNRKYASLQLVEALAYAPKPTTVVELCQEVPFQRSYSVINKVLNDFGTGSLFDPAKEPTPEESSQAMKNGSAAFAQITKPFSDLFLGMIPEEKNRKFRLFAVDASTNARIHAHTLDDRGYVYQANQIGIPVTIGLQVSVLTYLPEQMPEEANWQMPVSLERISTDTTPCEVARSQLELLAESTPFGELTVIVADSGYGNLEPYSSDQVVIARGRTDRQGKRPFQRDQTLPKERGRPRKYCGEKIRFIEDLPPGSENGSDEEHQYEDTMKGQQVDVLLNRWNDVYTTGALRAR